MNTSRVFIFVILFLVLFVVGFADVQSQYDTAQRYMMQGNCENAIPLFNQLMSDYPDSKFAKYSMRRIFQYYLSSKDQEELEQAVEKTVKDHITHPFMADLLDTMAGELQYQADYEKAKILFKQIVKWYPESDYYQKVLLDVKKVDILSFIHFNDPNKAQQLCDQMFVENSGNPYMPQALRHIATTYDKHDYESYAEALGQLIIDTYPESPDAATVQAEGYTSYGDYEAAKTLCSRVIKDFPNTINSEKAAKNLASLIDIDNETEAQNTVNALILIYPANLTYPRFSPP